MVYNHGMTNFLHLKYLKLTSALICTPPPQKKKKDGRSQHSMNWQSQQLMKDLVTVCL